ncbi:MAG: suppressor of fused domain protein [Lachnospiraceae bacterium]|nr:suppressor of fused domain protein [Lachnospiraceae bacterium]
MEKNNIGELIMDHYEKYLGEFEDCLIFKGDENSSSIQLLQYDNVFKDCKTYATIGLSKYADIIKDVYEVVMVVDDAMEECATILANALFYIINNNVKLNRGTYIEGIKNINEEFGIKHNKTAVYFTETYAFPDEFSTINEEVKMCLAFFISEEECDYIRKFGCDKFEDYLEDNNVDIMNINRQ